MQLHRVQLNRLRLHSLFALIIMSCATLACSLGRVELTPKPVVFVPSGTVPATNTPRAQQNEQTADTTQATSAPDTSQPAAATSCAVRGDWPIYSVIRGDSLSLIAAEVGITVKALATANCLADVSTIIVVGQKLHVPRMPPPPTITPLPTAVPSATIPPTTECAVSWFFKPNANWYPPSCPKPVRPADAVGENFEGGRVIWYVANPEFGSHGAVIYVIYNDRTYAQFADTYTEGEPESDPSLTPPPDRYQPVRGIGKVWRENAEVRQKLGWAYEPEIPFKGFLQVPESFNCNCERYYIAHGQSGYALELVHGLTAGTMEMYNWSVVGGY